MEKKRRFHYDALFKHKAIVLAETEGTRAESRALGVQESRIRDWRKQRDDFLWSVDSEKELSESDSE